MNILFCSEGFIVDGVASYNLYMAAALRQAGHRVAVLGRWAGFKGFQRRHRETGVTVVQIPSLTVNHPWLRRQARRFEPDIIITDARRSFPLAAKISAEQPRARLITVFHDPPDANKQVGVRSLDSLADRSHAWVTPEKRIEQALEEHKCRLPIRFIQRPITHMMHPTVLPPKAPFRVVCLGRLSGWKSPGIRRVVQDAVMLKQAIESLEIIIVGGGRRRWNVMIDAIKAHQRSGCSFIYIAGAQIDPRPWVQRASVVCAGATSAIEAVLSNRPVVAFSGFWHGLITPDNVATGLETHFGERAGAFYVRDQPEMIARTLIDLYMKWDADAMAGQTDQLRRQLAAKFDATVAVAQLLDLVNQI